ncbi:MAG TPA: SGNH/GDSL hydrolase family protein [Gemmatimonadaceae bacterium]|nr:SGNH/GDSL hydrolase family protein [Gemmatimonadaceae bacterium]
MMYRMTNLVRVAAVGGLFALAACESKRDAIGPTSPSGGDIFRSYVAIGNSITAGFQSNGINDSTQRQSYARLLAGQMGTRYAYASLKMPGCTAPIANTQTGALVAGAAPTACSLRDPASITDVLTNVAVPGARVLDPASRSTVASNALTTFILGGKTQVERALDAKPTFATVWIGNNDVLVAGLSGILVPTPALGQNGIISTQAQFQVSYDSLISQLTGGAPGLKGVLIGVAQVANLPSLSAGAVIAGSPQILAGLSLAAGTPVTVLPNCTGSTALINVPQLLGAIRAKTHPALISCGSAAPIAPAPVGDIFVLDPQEQATLAGVINGYNTYIKGKADAIGFAYYDPNVLFAAKRASGEIPPFPSLNLPTATFGPLISLDGVHPTGAAHILIANEIIGVINAKYGTSLKPVQ